MTAVLARGLALGLVLTAAVPVTAGPPTQSEIEESLTCQCGCGLTVHSCNHIQCGSGEPIKKEIAERLARGEGKDQILAAFREKFGEKVLSSPTMEGFNRLAWIMPFATLLVAGTILTVVIRRRQATAEAPVPAAARPAGDEALRAQLARELERFDRES